MEGGDVPFALRKVRDFLISSGYSGAVVWEIKGRGKARAQSAPPVHDKSRNP
jgi:nitrogen regulatory protein PII